MHTQRNVRLSKQANQELQLLKGYEVQSLIYEGCVYVNKAGEVIRESKTVDTLNTNKKVRELFIEMLESEGIY